jgi:hypothetical protein
MNPTLYEQDYYLWLNKTALQLRTGDLDQLDLPNLAEEIEDMGKSEKRAFESNLTVILLHLLKYKYQPTHRSNSWLSSLLEHRLRLKKQLKDSPSLKPYWLEVFAECYDDARLLAATETQLALSTFPTSPPFTPEEVLDLNYFPDADGDSNQNHET